MSVINSIPLIAAGDDGYQISRSVRLRSSASAYFNRTPASAGNRQKWTWSGWVKRGAFPTSANSVLFSATGSTFGGTLNYTYGGNQDKLYLQFDGGNGGSFATNAVFRDPSGWYHIVVSVDTTQATSTNRVFIYVNGVQQTFSSSSYPTQNYNTEFNSANSHGIGAYPTPNQYFDGYLTEVNFIDGQALTPSSFGETDAITGVWKPKKYAGTYGTNGFYLNFSDNSNNTAATIGKDYSGNGNNWTPNNISVTSGVTYDSMLDVPTLYADGGNGRGNYAVLNPLALRRDVSTTVTFADGNLKATFNNAGGNTTHAWGTQGITSGSFYWEITVNAAPSNVAIGIGGQGDIDGTSNNSVIYINGGGIYKYGTLQTTGASYTTNDIIGIAYDATAGTLAFYKNNSLQYTVTGLTYTPSLPFNRGTTSDSIIANFGQRPFAYTPPTGFKALNTQNLPEPVIKKGNQYFDATTWTGNSATRSIVNSGAMQPDFVWIKDRSTTAWHVLFDSVRGVGKELNSNSTSAEVSNNIYGYLNSFNSDGFGVVSGTTGYDNVNKTGEAYVGWQWKANGSAVTNTSGSITSQVNAGTSQGFSVVTFTSPASGSFTVGHGLGVAPRMIITKERDGTLGWLTYHASVNSKDDYMVLNSTAAKSGVALNSWGTALPTSTVFGMTSGTSVNASKNVVAYCFSEVAGFSKFGSYTGNGSTDGPFVFCGFRPAFIMIKRTDTTGNWTIHDNRRSGYNGSSASKELYPNLSNAEGSDSMDQLSNGFKLRDTYSDVNASGGTYIFMALAESPFRTSLAR